MAVTPPRTVTPPNQTQRPDDASRRQRSSFTQSSYSHGGKRRVAAHPRVRSASPEVISNLISSLDAIARDTEKHFESIPDLNGNRLTPSAQTPSVHSSEPTPSQPARGGAFSAEHGAFDTPPVFNIPYIDDAAEPPVVRTSKPPSGLSPLTAPKYPKTSSSGSLKSYLRSSKSSNSLRSKEKDDKSSQELEVARSQQNSRDSSTSRQNRWGHKGLVFMTSKERLRASDTERRRATLSEHEAVKDEGNHHGTRPATVPEIRTPSPRRPMLAETVIQEEASPPQYPATKHTVANDSPVKVGKRKMERIEPNNPATINGHTLVPERGSSLRHPHSSPRQSKSDLRGSSRRNSVPNKPSSSSVGSVVGSISREKPPPDETEEEKVTRRIRELKAQKEKRMREMGSAPSPSSGRRVRSYTVGSRSLNDSDPALDGKMLLDPPADHEQQSKTKARRILGIPITPPQSPTSKDPPTANQISKPGYSPEGETDSPALLAEYKKALDILNGRSLSSTGPSSPTTPPRNGYRKGDLIAPPVRDSSAKNRHRWSQPADVMRPRDGDLRNSVRDDLMTARKASLEVRTERRSTSVPEGRPPSMDSIDFAVDDFLRSPRLSQKVKHPQTGRVVAFSEVGDPKGYAVISCVGMGLTRYVTAFYDELATTLKLRLITLDRPGIGGSEAYTEREGTPLSWPDDVLTVCQHLRINKFSLLAHSAGAIYALATALRLPQHIRGRVHLLAPWIPPSQMSAIGLHSNTPPSGALPRSQRFLRVLPTTFLKAANSSFMRATSSSVSPNSPQRTPRKSGDRVRESSVPAANDASGKGNARPSPARHDSMALMDRVLPDRQSITDMRTAARAQDRNSVSAAAAQFTDKERKQELDSRLTLSIWDLATQNANPAVDLLVCLERTQNIGFRYVDITRSVVIHHGSKDTRVPVENIKWLGNTMRKCEVRILEGEGHGLMASAVVMGNVLTEISKEWEDWTRAARGARGERRRDGGS
ncbi:MAG: hypothetical protein M1820_000529 [Bogoriella megaspora]|nr:MAG: hypothetical protein M1820_000529 [Bogoriella megaspora]